MNLSRRAKLDRVAGDRGETRRAPVAVASPEPAPVIAPASEPEPAPLPVVAEERPKLPKFVRQASEKRTAASPAPLSPPTSKLAGKVMSKNLAAAPKRAGMGAKGPQLARVPISNSKSVAAGRRK